MYRLITRIAVACLLAFPFSAQADLFGVLDGRSAKPGDIGEMTVEAGYITGDNYTNIAGRFNYQISPVLTVYADFAQPDADVADGTAYGAGIRYYLANQGFLENMDVSVRASFHTATYDFISAFGAPEVDVDDMSVALHIGGQQPISSNGINWYGVLSYNTRDFGVESDSEIGYGGGIYLPFGSGIVFAGAEHIEDLFMGVGYRHFLGGR